MKKQKRNKETWEHRSKHSTTDKLTSLHFRSLVLNYETGIGLKHRTGDGVLLSLSLETSSIATGWQGTNLRVQFVFSKAQYVAWHQCRHAPLPQRWPLRQVGIQHSTHSHCCICVTALILPPTYRGTFSKIQVWSLVHNRCSQMFALFFENELTLRNDTT